MTNDVPTSAASYKYKSRNLGLVFNSTLSWTNHINAAIEKVHGMLRNLWTHRHSSPFDIRMHLTKSNLIPTLSIWLRSILHIAMLKIVINWKSPTTTSQDMCLKKIMWTYIWIIFNIYFDNLINLKCLVLLQKIFILLSLNSYLNSSNSHDQAKELNMFFRGLIVWSKSGTYSP